MNWWVKLNKKQRAYLIGFVALASIMLWAFISAGVITHDFNRNQLSTSKDRQEAVISGVILTETKDEKKYWEIYGETGSYDSNNEVAMLDNVIGNFYKENEVAMSFQSSKGAYNSAKKVIILYNDTFIVLKDGTTLKADRLRYAGSDMPVVATGNVEITRGGIFLATADKVEINPNFESFRISGNTTSKIFEEKE